MHRSSSTDIIEPQQQQQQAQNGSREKRIRKPKLIDDDYISYNDNDSFTITNSNMLNNTNRSSAPGSTGSIQNELRHNIGDLVWAKVSGHPWWPCTISRDVNESNSFVKAIGTTRQKRVYFVEFFGPSVEHAWVSEGGLIEYKGIEAFKTYAQDQVDQAPTKSQKEKLAERFQLKVALTRRDQWEQAVEEADDMLNKKLSGNSVSISPKNASKSASKKSRSKQQQQQQSETASSSPSSNSQQKVSKRKRLSSAANSDDRETSLSASAKIIKKGKTKQQEQSLDDSNTNTSSINDFSTPVDSVQQTTPPIEDEMHQFDDKQSIRNSLLSLSSSAPSSPGGVRSFRSSSSSSSSSSSTSSSSASSSSSSSPANSRRSSISSELAAEQDVATALITTNNQEKSSGLCIVSPEHEEDDDRLSSSSSLHHQDNSSPPPLPSSTATATTTTTNIPTIKCENEQVSVKNEVSEEPFTKTSNNKQSEQTIPTIVTTTTTPAKRPVGRPVGSSKRNSTKTPSAIQSTAIAVNKSQQVTKSTPTQATNTNILSDRKSNVNNKESNEIQVKQELLQVSSKKRGRKPKIQTANETNNVSSSVNNKIPAETVNPKQQAPATLPTTTNEFKLIVRKTPTTNVFKSSLSVTPKPQTQQTKPFEIKQSSKVKPINNNNNNVDKFVNINANNFKIEDNYDDDDDDEDEEEEEEDDDDFGVDFMDNEKLNESKSESRKKRSITTDDNIDIDFDDFGGSNAQHGSAAETYLIDRYKYAVRHIKQGLSVEEACNKYRISKGALLKCLNGGTAPRGKKTRLSESEENMIVEWLISNNNLKYNEAIHLVFQQVADIFQKANRPNPFNNGKPSMDWWYDFLSRHPQIMASKPDWLMRGKVNDQYIKDVQSGKLKCTKFRRALLSAIQYIRSLSDESSTKTNTTPSTSSTTNVNKTTTTTTSQQKVKKRTTTKTTATTTPKTEATASNRRTSKNVQASAGAARVSAMSYHHSHNTNNQTNTTTTATNNSINTSNNTTASNFNRLSNFDNFMLNDDDLHITPRTSFSPVSGSLLGNTHHHHHHHNDSSPTTNINLMINNVVTSNDSFDEDLDDDDDNSSMIDTLINSTSSNTIRLNDMINDGGGCGGGSLSSSANNNNNNDTKHLDLNSKRLVLRVKLGQQQPQHLLVPDDDDDDLKDTIDPSMAFLP